MTTTDAITELMSKASLQIFGSLPEEIRILGFKRTTDKPDANAADIIENLRGRGYEVVRINQPVDYTVYDPVSRLTGWMEIKTESRSAKITRGQLTFMSNTRQPTAFVKTIDEALAFADGMNGLTQEQKNRLALLLRSDKRDVFGVAVVERVLRGEK